MIKQLHFKWMLLLCALMVGTNVAWGQNTYELVTSISSLSDGDKIILVDGTTDGTHNALGGANSGTNRKSVSVTVSSSSVTTNVDNGNETITNVNTKSDDRNLPYEVTLVKSGENWTLKETIKDGDVFLNGGSKTDKGKNNNHLKAGESAETETGVGKANGVYSITIDGSSHAATIKNQNNYYIQKNSSSAIYSTYSSDQSAVYIYKKVESSPLASIALSGTYQTSFYQNDAFNHDGVVVTATFVNGTERVVTASASFSEPDMTTTGTKTVTVSYTENEITKTATYNITVNPQPTLTSIVISGIYTTVFNQYSIFNHDGLVVTAHFDDSSSNVVTEDADFSSPDMTTVGVKTITVSYTVRGVTKTATYDITVNAYVQPTAVMINLSNSLFGISTGNNGEEQTTTVDNVAVTTGCKSSATSKTYYADNHIRFYADSYLVLQAPVGYAITAISLNRYNSDTWNGNKVTPSTGSFAAANADTAPLEWSGFASAVRFDYEGQCRTASIDVTLANTQTVGITAVGLATFVTDAPLDYTSVDGIEAYIATTDGSTISLTKKNKVPANTGVLLRATAGGTSFVVPVATGATDDVTGNLFVRGAGTAVASSEAGYYNYILNNVGGVLGFYRAADNTVAKNRAFLHTTLNANAVALDFDNMDDMTTGISAIEHSPLNIEHSEVYNLNGQRVSQPTKGLYIVNGKKVVVK